MDLKEYFNKNNITKKDIKTATKEHINISKIMDDSIYYDLYYKSNLDDFIDSVDYDLNLDLFQIILNESKKYLDLFEPCCQSGLLGNFIYLNNNHKNNFSYNGIDINEIAINKAKRRAIHNSSNENIFTINDFFEYKKEHETIIGRYILNDKVNKINNKFIDKSKEISKNIITIQTFQDNLNYKQGILEYVAALKKHGFESDILNKPTKSNATNAINFILKAYKK
ncbi:MAG: hypothetical protein ACOC3X_01025 [Nanoarchaeota archaeon]